MGMPHIDVKDVSSSAMYDGVLDHLDIVVLPSPGKSSCAALAPFVERGLTVYACARTASARAALLALPAERVKAFENEKALADAIGSLPRVMRRRVGGARTVPGGRCLMRLFFFLMCQTG